MKMYKKKIMTLLTMSVLLTTAFMTGCTRLTEAKNDTSAAADTSPVADTPLATDAPAEARGFGVYVKLERDDASSIFLHGGSFSKACENADGSLLKAGEWIFTGEDIAQLSEEENCSVLFTVGAMAADDTILGEASFLYDIVQEKLYVTISAEGVTCATSDAPDAPADVPPVLTLPILDEIDAGVTVGTAGSSLAAVQAAVKLLDWGVNTGLGVDEISDAASTWLAAKNADLNECLHKLELVDDAYQKLLTDAARELLDSAGCAEVEITWGSEPVEPVEAIMQAAGLRSADDTQIYSKNDGGDVPEDASTDEESWKIAFEKSLLENYGVRPDHYEELDEGIYQVYVEIDGKIVPYVVVNSATGDYHG